MPIVVKDHTSQDELDRIYISVPLRNVHPSKVDIYSNSAYIKANYPPYFFELDLAHEIDSEASNASVGNNEILFELVKISPGAWKDIKYAGNDLLERRKRAESKAHLREEAKKKENLLAKREKEREMVRHQMAVEKSARLKVQELKDLEIQTAKDHISTWQKELSEKKQISTITSSHNGISHKSGEISVKSHDSGIFTIPLDHSGESEESDEDIDLNSLRIRLKAKSDLLKHAPPRRATTSVIKVSFTSRGSIPTNTARESEDSEWYCFNVVKWMTRIKLSKAMHALKGGDVMDLNGDLKNGNVLINLAQILKEKGNSFFKLGNYEGAMNAYTGALEIDRLDISCISNRAACHLKLGDGAKCVEDCTLGLETIKREEDMLKDEIKQDDGGDEVRRKNKMKLFVRRGTSFVNLLGAVEDGIADYVSALALDPENSALSSDLDSLRSRVAIEKTP